MVTSEMAPTGEKTKCLGSCTVQYGGQYGTTKGLGKAKCDGSIQSVNKIGFWCEYRDDGSVMMVGGGGGGCDDTTYHGIGITAARVASFAEHFSPESDFGDSPYSGRGTKAYSLSLWIH